MTDNDIRMAQVEAGEQAVIDRLRAKGLMADSDSPTPQPDSFITAKQAAAAVKQYSPGAVFELITKTAEQGKRSLILFDSAISCQTRELLARGGYVLIIEGNLLTIKW